MVAIVLAASALGAAEIPSVFKYDSKGRRDPFVPLAGVEKAGTKGGIKGVLSIEDVVLQGIVMGADGKRRAIINGEVMKEGDTIEHVSIISVNENGVKLNIEGTEHEVKLYK